MTPVSLALGQCRREGRCAGAFGGVVRIGEEHPHRLRDLIIGDADDALDPGTDVHQGLRIRHAAGESVREPGLDRVADRVPLFERERVGRGVCRDHADDRKPATERTRGRHHAADARAQPDRHVHRLEVGRRAQEFDGIGRDPADQVPVVGGHDMESLLGCDALGMLARFLEIAARFDQRHAKCAHRRVLLAAVPERHHDGRGNAVEGSGKPDRLAVVSARGADDTADARLARRQAIEVDEPAAQLECSDGSGVLVLHPDRRAEPFAEQRPAILRGSRERPRNNAGRILDLGERGERFAIADVRGEIRDHRSCLQR